MITFFDTSAIVPLLVEESASERCEQIWTDALRVHIASITIAETAAALAQARRMGRIDGKGFEHALQGAGSLWEQCAISPVSTGLARRAAGLAVLHGLRGFDAVQCAAGLLIEQAGGVGVAGDRTLLQAWLDAGLPVLDVAR